VLTVSDAAILEAPVQLLRLAGLFTEPAGAAAFAGFPVVRHTLPEDAVFVVPATANGLKDSDAAAKGICIAEKTVWAPDDVTVD
jgi:threonine synthase